MALTQDRLKELLRYEPETGLFFWVSKTSNRVRIGDVAGCKEKANGGYILIGIDGAIYGAHRLAWLFVHGELPIEVDHENGQPWDNRLSNLREASRSQNQSNRRKPKNNTSGFKGVVPHQGKWMARIVSKGKTRRFSGFDTPEEAAAAYDLAAKNIHGEFARLNEGG